MKQIIVNVNGLSLEEKQRVNEALAKIMGVRQIPNINPRAGWFFAPASSGKMVVTWNLPYEPKTPTHTPQQVLGMAGMAKQGHVHADLMAIYSEDAKTTDKPWLLWQNKAKDGFWWDCLHSPLWSGDTEYRRKPKTHTVHGVEIPDLRVTPELGDKYYLADPTTSELTELHTFVMKMEKLWVERGLTYQNTEEGKQAAILHSKAMLGMVQE